MKSMTATDAVATAQVGEDEGPFAAHQPRVAAMTVKIRADMGGEIGLVDDRAGRSA
jgi:hypothetical protein